MDDRDVLIDMDDEFMDEQSYDEYEMSKYDDECIDEIREEKCDEEVK